MVDSCVIDRPERSMNWDPQAGHDEPTMSRVYEGKCRLRQQTSYGTAPTTGGHTYELQQTELHIPRGASYEPHVGDVATVTGYAYPFRIRGLINQTHRTATRMLVDAETD